MIKKIKYWYYYFRIQAFQDSLGSVFFSDFNKTHRATLYYLASKDLDYTFFKVYCIWGVDGLTDAEKSRF